MKISAVALLAGLAAVTAAAPSPAHAEVQYPWCAQYRRPIDATNCGFVNYQQCMETISGIGGYCYRNLAYQPPRDRPRRR